MRNYYFFFMMNCFFFFFNDDLSVLLCCARVGESVGVCVGGWGTWLGLVKDSKGYGMRANKN